ncbi:NADH-quinone oxidoreductase subunit NuoF [Peloplasma aerotolerans]|uniref:NADH-quinone oxidoreductase subunit NuoF n=1 Tax=Peloplasma aerotolerans TaxID=3044389 RepID=A0AAW6UAN0_9MOLU|nr:NADH-quinone oxidoreductase subunit NuoF [Mariniplasma sp. M4Ah]MDI6452709.1 NADH-quinone oxidoreductase subunit NuoF [Mariniplasma sp. M4Ah]
MLERIQVLICGGTGCLSSQAKQIKEKFEEQLELMDMKNEVGLILTGCFGLCEKGPVVIVYPGETFYTHVKIEDVITICQEHLLKGRPVEKLMMKDPIEKTKIKNISQLKFYSKQKRIALRNCGNINPLNIEEYIAKDGYQALADVLTKHTPQETIDTMIESGLRGRGGGGFSTGKKWQFAKDSVSEQKYVICNADEGDPGAFMDRAILEGDPHSVLEAMAICGYAIGANQGYIYVRAEYPVAVERLNIAINQAKQFELLGKNIFGTSFSFNIEIRLGAGAFVCGEETALIASIEGYRGMPRLKPPFPAVRGLWGKPTNVNNVETLANIPVIFLKGAKWFKTIGTEKSSGTKVFALGGKINNTGLVEVPMGTTLREIVFDIGGGIPNKRKFKAIQTGGPSGGCITEKDLDTPIDFENLTALGSMMGSGGMIVMDEDNCMVDVARFYLDFTVEESCGKCTPCREGTKQMLVILNKICEGLGTLKDLEELEKLGHMIQETSLCGLGQTAPNPVLSTLKDFKHEYLAHVVDKTCTAGVCRELTNFVIDDHCIGCTKCAKSCPVNAISGWPKQLHVIDLELCIRCGECKKACPVNAITSSPLHQEARI